MSMGKMPFRNIYGRAGTKPVYELKHTYMHVRFMKPATDLSSSEQNKRTEH